MIAYSQYEQSNKEYYIIDQHIIVLSKVREAYNLGVRTRVESNLLFTFQTCHDCTKASQTKRETKEDLNSYVYTSVVQVFKG